MNELSTEIRAGLEIDPDALDVELMRQPQLYFDLAEQLAEAEKRHDHAKRELDEERARSAGRAREALGGDGSRITDARVQAEVSLDGKVMVKAARLEALALDVGILNAAVRAANQRKDALEGLARLAVMGYFSTPSMPRELRERARESRTAMRADMVRSILAKRQQEEPTGAKQEAQNVRARRALGNTARALAENPPAPAPRVVGRRK